MRFTLVTLLLAPILLVQGRYVRRVTPRLPEAAGERADRCGQGPLLRLLVLGDSAAAGVGAGNQRAALAGQLAANLATTHEVAWLLHAQTGWLLADLVDSLAGLGDSRFDVAVISIGVNDVTGRTSDRRWQQGLRDLAGHLHTQYGVNQLLFSPVPPMHQFPALPQPLRWYLGMRAHELNTQLRAVLAGDPKCEVLNMALPNDRAYIASDGFHPSERTYAEWAQQAAVAIRRRIRT